METDHQVALDQVAHVDKELRIERIHRAAADLDRVERFEAIDDRFIESIPNPNCLNIFPGKPRIANPRASRVAGQNSEKKIIQDNDKQDRE